MRMKTRPLAVVTMLSSLAVSLLSAQEPAKVAPQNYKVSVMDTRGSVSPDGRLFSYVDWSTGDLAVRDLRAR